MVLVLLMAALFGVGVLVPWNRWRLEVDGRSVEIRNYLGSEKVVVDGVVLSDTKVRGDGLRWAEHAFELGDRKLRAWIGMRGVELVCRVDDGRRVLFDSGSEPPPIEPPQLEVAPADEDPRLVAARHLLGDVAALEPGAARDLEAALERVLGAEAAARRAVEAHAALGGDADAERLVAARVRAVDEVLATLRRLHLQVAEAGAERDVGPALDAAREALARLGAVTEVEGVDAASLARERARRASAQREG